MAPPERLELSLPAPEADALSTELRGRAQRFYHRVAWIKKAQPVTQFKAAGWACRLVELFTP